MDTNFTFTFTGGFSAVAVAAVLSVEMILALIANGIVLLITLTQKKSWKQPSTIFLTSLILAHLVINLLCLPFTIIALAAGEWIFGSTDEVKQGFCEFNAYILWFGATVIGLTLDAISFDRFLFIVKPHLHKRFMKPWVALTITATIWLLSALMCSFPLAHFGSVFLYFSDVGTCGLFFTNPVLSLLSFLSLMIMVGIIVITSVWTFCFTRKFIRNQSLVAGESIYARKKKRLFGIFGAMLLIYGICLTPGILASALIGVQAIPNAVFFVILVPYILMTVLGPVIQAYFKPEIVDSVIFVYRKISKKSASNAESVVAVNELSLSHSFSHALKV